MPVPVPLDPDPPADPVAAESPIAKPTPLVIVGKVWQLLEEGVIWGAAGVTVVPTVYETGVPSAV